MSTPLAPVLPIPSAEQLAWQRLEMTAFFHFGINTFTNAEIGDGTDDPALFSPTQLDTAQWLDTVKAAGFGMGILVAKHHDGFCLWPTAHTDYSVAASPWRGGQGDLVDEFVTAARTAGIRVGLYLSPFDEHESSYGTSAYNTFFQNLLTELLTGYGEIAEIWFDGYNAPSFDWNAVYRHVRALSPATLIAITGPDIRWVGTEDGIAPIGETSVQEGAPNLGQPTGLVWYPSESDVSIRPGWFWHASEDSQVKSLNQLLDIYYGSVGRNSTLLLNVPPNDTGLLAAPDVAVLTDFGAALRALYGTNLAVGASVSADSTIADAPDRAPAMAVDESLATYWAAASGTRSARLDVDFGMEIAFDVISLREPIEYGERASRYHVEVEQGGIFTTIASGTVIGQRNLLVVPNTTATKLAVVIEDARAAPALAELGLYRQP